MQQHAFGPLPPVSILTLGGGGLGMLWGETSFDECVATVHATVAAGINLIDLAPSYGDGRLLSTGIYLGCLGVGLPFALAAKLANPSRPVVLLCGDGTFGLNAMELDTAVRHDIPIVCVISNDGSWGMSRHGQVRNHGHTVATDLGVRPYHEVARALGGYGEFVDEASEIRGAIERASASGLPSVVNVAIDPEICSPYTEMMAALESG